MTALWFFVGFILGGCCGTVGVCCWMIHRSNHYEREIRNLRNQLNKKQ